MDNIDRQLEQLIERNANKISHGGQIMFMTCVNSFTFGCNWGFIKKDTQAFKDTVEALKEEKQNIHFYRVNNGIMIECNERYLYHVIDTIFEGKCPVNYQQLAERRKSEPETFAKWMKRVRKDITKLPYVKPAKLAGGYEITCAVCGVNDSHEIRVGGVSYPAFKLSLNEMLTMFSSNPDFANTHIGVMTESGGFTYAPISQIYGNTEYTKAVYRAATISESNTGLFIKLWVQ